MLQRIEREIERNSPWKGRGGVEVDGEEQNPSKPRWGDWELEEEGVIGLD